jgi:hypothetical protein
MKKLRDLLIPARPLDPAPMALHLFSSRIETGSGDIPCALSEKRRDETRRYATLGA